MLQHELPGIPARAPIGGAVVLRHDHGENEADCQNWKRSFRTNTPRSNAVMRPPGGAHLAHARYVHRAVIFSRSSLSHEAGCPRRLLRKTPYPMLWSTRASSAAHPCCTYAPGPPRCGGWYAPRHRPISRFRDGSERRRSPMHRRNQRMRRGRSPVSQTVAPKRAMLHPVFVVQPPLIDATGVFDTLRRATCTEPSIPQVV